MLFSFFLLNQLQTRIGWKSLATDERTLLEEIRGRIQVSREDVFVGLVIAFLYCTFIFCRSYAGIMGDAITDDEDLDITTEEFSQMLVSGFFRFLFCQPFCFVFFRFM